MKMKILPAILLVSLCCAVATQAKPTEPAKPIRAAIFDESANASQQIAEALALAHKDGKHVLLDFGANWCIWCRRLHALFESDPTIAAELKKNYIVVMVDVNKKHNDDVDAKYGHPTSHGLPVLVVLDADGKQLTTQDSGKLEKGKYHDPEKVLALLKEWAPK